ncbi:dehydrogenase [Deltaproteobacteria bacterium Smac51]|nr:dehydrogenase [Deltaproteobacteria bacterium Smac51]
MNRLKTAAFSLIVALAIVGFIPSAGQAEKEVPAAMPFKGKVIIDGLDEPWAMIWGPEGKLWLTERHGKRITEVDPKSGEKHILATIEEAYVGPQHEGLLGLALAPDFDKSGHLYLAYTYMDGNKEREKVVRLNYDAKDKKLSNPKTVIEGIPAGNDHQGGRLIFGPDGMLYLSKGELGHNQMSNRCKLNEAQRLPTKEEVAAKDWTAYVGKVLRMTPDGGIPEDNPELKGVKSHVFTYGHRNPQGLVFVGDVLYSVEHGPSTDDELNRLESGGNYGWPLVAGFKDDQAYVYANWSADPACESYPEDLATIPDTVPQKKESEFNEPNFKEPLKTFFTVAKDYEFSDPKYAGPQSYVRWATIGPSSVDYYPEDGPIKAWRNSLLISTLKNGSLYRVPLHSDKKQVQGDVAKYFTTQNRYRQVLVAPEGDRIYLITDNGGSVVGEDGIPTDKVKNSGAVLVFEYDGK